MTAKLLRGGVATLLLVGSVAAYSVRGQSIPVGTAPLPAGATRCDLSVPITVEMLPLNRPSVGEAAEFQVVVESTIDPDTVRRSWVEYSVRRRGAATRETVESRDRLGRGRGDRLSFGVPIADGTRHEVRARYVVELSDGRRIAQTAVRWVDLDDEDLPEGIIGRIQNADGTGIRVYRGLTDRN